MRRYFRRAAAGLLCLALLLGLAPMGTAASELHFRTIISPQYQDARAFSEDLAAVKQNGLWGYIDRNGKTVIPFAYDVACSFSEGKAIVAKSQKSKYNEDDRVLSWGMVDRENHYTPLQAEYTYGFDQFETYYYGEELESGSYSYIHYYNGVVLLREGAYPRAFDADGKELLAGTTVSPQFAPTEGSMTVRYAEGSGYVKAATIAGGGGEKLLDGQTFDAARPFNQGLAMVADYSPEGPLHWRVIDTAGKTVIPGPFLNFYVTDYYGEFRVFGDGGLASVQNIDGKWGAIDKTGKVVIPFEYDALHPFVEGLAAFQKDGKAGYLDCDGNIIIRPEYNDASDFRDGIAVVMEDTVARCIDRTGSKIQGADKLPTEFYFRENGLNMAGEAVYLIEAPERYVLVKEYGKYGFGKIDFTPSRPTSGEMDAWAEAEVLQAVEAGLIPARQQNLYRMDITRRDFAALVIQLIEKTENREIQEIIREETGKSLYTLIGDSPFRDTQELQVVAAHALGIINGVGDRRFDPYSPITRQDAAALLMRTAQYLGQSAQGVPKQFSDAGEISDYARTAVEFVSASGVMNGTEETRFSPKLHYTRQQAYLTFLRLYQNLK